MIPDLCVAYYACLPVRSFVPAIRIRARERDGFGSVKFRESSRACGVRLGARRRGGRDRIGGWCVASQSVFDEYEG